MIVREIFAADVSIVAPLFVEIFNEPPWNDGWSIEIASERLLRFINTPSGFGVLALDDGTPTGFALGFLERWTNREDFLLKEMCVKRDRQRSGIGKLILDDLSRRLVEKGVRSIYLQTRPGSHAASFYEQSGFEEAVLSTMTRSLAPPNGKDFSR